jgi:hypothetical protein
MSDWWVDRTIHADGWEIHIRWSESSKTYTLTPNEALDVCRWLVEPGDLRDAILDACREPDLCARHGCTRYATDGGLCALDSESVA